jgi:hypothetical protein
VEQSPALPKNAERLAIVRLARDSAIELILTFILLFGVTTIVLQVLRGRTTLSCRNFGNSVPWKCVFWS